MNEIVDRYTRFYFTSLPMGPFFDGLTAQKCEVMRTQCWLLRDISAATTPGTYTVSHSPLKECVLSLATGLQLVFREPCLLAYQN